MQRLGSEAVHRGCRGSRVCSFQLFLAMRNITSWSHFANHPPTTLFRPPAQVTMMHRGCVTAPDQLLTIAASHPIVDKDAIQTDSRPDVVSSSSRRDVPLMHDQQAASDSVTVRFPDTMAPQNSDSTILTTSCNQLTTHDVNHSNTSQNIDSHSNTCGSSSTNAEDTHNGPGNTHTPTRDAPSRPPSVPSSALQDYTLDSHTDSPLSLPTKRHEHLVPERNAASALSTQSNPVLSAPAVASPPEAARQAYYPPPHAHTIAPPRAAFFQSPYTAIQWMPYADGPSATFEGTAWPVGTHQQHSALPVLGTLLQFKHYRPPMASLEPPAVQPVSSARQSQRTWDVPRP